MNCVCNGLGGATDNGALDVHCPSLWRLTDNGASMLHCPLDQTHRLNSTIKQNMIFFGQCSGHRQPNQTSTSPNYGCRRSDYRHRRHAVYKHEWLDEQSTNISDKHTTHLADKQSTDASSSSSSERTSRTSCPDASPHPARSCYAICSSVSGSSGTWPYYNA